MAFWLAIHFLLYGVLASSTKFMPITPATMIVLYLGYCSGIDKWYFDKLCIIAITVVCFLSLEIDLTYACRYMKHEQNIMGSLAILVWVVMIFSEALRTEGDSVIDSLVFYMLALTFFVTR